MTSLAGAFIKAGRFFAEDAGRTLRGLARLPPGPLNPLENGMFKDQAFILRQAAIHGPIFKVMWSKNLLVCLLGNARGRQFLKAHESQLEGVSIDLRKLFPEGIIRNMAGAGHHACKHDLARILDPAILAGQDELLRKIVRRHLSDFAATQNPTPLDVRNMTVSIALDCMLSLFFGQPAAGLRESYLKFGPTGLEWNIQQPQMEAYAEIVEALKTNPPGPKPPNYFAEAEKHGSVSSAVMGNLIYMAEMGRYDVAGLLRWILKYLTENHTWAEDIHSKDGAVEHAVLANAFVLETMRLNQVAGLIRRTTGDIVFEGHFIPKSSYIRICLWESHKDEEHFAEPFAFDPRRFLDGAISPDKFAPFGLDMHRCLGVDIVPGLARMFIEEIAMGYLAEKISDGPPSLDFTIWAPSLDFSARLSPRGHSLQSAAVG